MVAALFYAVWTDGIPVYVDLRAVSLSVWGSGLDELIPVADQIYQVHAI